MSRDDLAKAIATTSFLEELFDPVADIVFFIKDRDGCYARVNRTLVERCGLENKSDLIGRKADDVFPHSLGERYFRQDRTVLDEGEPIIDRFELHLFPNRTEGWCLTNKVPLKNDEGDVIGLVGFSRDIHVTTGGEGQVQSELAEVVAHIQLHFAEDLHVDILAKMADMSAYQLNRRIRAIFGITAGQLIAKTRIDAASQLLRSAEPTIAEVALKVGYCDQSAFSRQFKASVGLTPRQYRALHSE